MGAAAPTPATGRPPATRCGPGSWPSSSAPSPGSLPSASGTQRRCAKPGCRWARRCAPDLRPVRRRPGLSPPRRSRAGRAPARCRCPPGRRHSVPPPRRDARHRRRREGHECGQGSPGQHRVWRRGTSVGSETTGAGRDHGPKSATSHTQNLRRPSINDQKHIPCDRIVKQHTAILKINLRIHQTTNAI